MTLVLLLYHYIYLILIVHKTFHKKQCTRTPRQSLSLHCPPFRDVLSSNAPLQRAGGTTRDRGLIYSRSSDKSHQESTQSSLVFQALKVMAALCTCIPAEKCVPIMPDQAIDCRAGGYKSADANGLRNATQVTRF